MVYTTTMQIIAMKRMRTHESDRSNTRAPRDDVRAWRRWLPSQRTRFQLRQRLVVPLTLAPALGLVAVLFGSSAVYGITQSLGYLPFLGQTTLSLAAYRNVMGGTPSHASSGLAFGSRYGSVSAPRCWQPVVRCSSSWRGATDFGMARPNWRC